MVSAHNPKPKQQQSYKGLHEFVQCWSYKINEESIEVTLSNLDSDMIKTAVAMQLTIKHGSLNPKRTDRV